MLRMSSKAALAADPRWDRRATRPPQAGLLAALLAQPMLVAALLAILSLTGNGPGAAAWSVGVACAAITSLGLARARTHFRAERLTRADRVTLARAALVAVAAALVAESFEKPVAVAILVSVASAALALDAIDGWVARRTGIGSLGAKFDGEVDAFLILVLSVYVARSGLRLVAPDRRGALPVRGGRMGPCVDAGAAPAALLAQVRRGHPGDRPHGRGGERAARGGHARRRSPARWCCWPSPSAATRGGCARGGARRASSPTLRRLSRLAHAGGGACERRSPRRSQLSPCCSCGPPWSAPTSRSRSSSTRF